MSHRLTTGRLIGIFAIAIAIAGAVAEPSAASADPTDCTETIIVYDPHDLVWDIDVPVDLDTLIEVEGLVDDYTDQIDAALEAENEGLEPASGDSSDDLIDEARWEISDAIDLGRSIAECEEV